MLWKLLSNTDESLCPLPVNPGADRLGCNSVVALNGIFDIHLPIINLINHDVMTAAGIGRTAIDAGGNERVHSQGMIKLRKKLFRCGLAIRYADACGVQAVFSGALCKERRGCSRFTIGIAIPVLIRPIAKNGRKNCFFQEIGKNGRHCSGAAARLSDSFYAGSIHCIIWVRFPKRRIHEKDEWVNAVVPAFMLRRHAFRRICAEQRIPRLLAANTVCGQAVSFLKPLYRPGCLSSEKAVGVSAIISKAIEKFLQDLHVIVFVAFPKRSTKLTATATITANGRCEKIGFKYIFIQELRDGKWVTIASDYNIYGYNVTTKDAVLSCTKESGKQYRATASGYALLDGVSDTAWCSSEH